MRSGVLCVVLGGVLAFATHPEWLAAAWSWSQPQSPGNAPLVPPEILLRAANTAEARGDRAEALRLLSWFCEQHPKHLGVENALAQRTRHHLAMNQMVEARAIYQEFRMRFPASDQQRPLLRALAEGEYNLGNYEYALRSYKDLIGLAIRHVPASTRAEDTAPNNRTAQKAARQQQKQLEAKHNELERLARFNLALSHQQARQPTAAIQAYERFVRRFPNDSRVAEARFRMGILNLELGRLPQALKYFEPLCTREDVAPSLRSASIYHAGRGNEKLMKLEEARHFYGMASVLTPAEDTFRLAALSRLARIIAKTQPLRALEVYRDLAANSNNSVRRAIARQHLIALQGEATVASATREVPE